MSQVQVQAQKVQSDSQIGQMKGQADMASNNAKAAVENKEADIKFLEVMSKMQGADLDNQLEQERISAENARTAVEMSLETEKHLLEVDKMKNEKNEE